jgi:hypothetical protein
VLGAPYQLQKVGALAQVAVGNYAIELLAQQQLLGALQPGAVFHFDREVAKGRSQQPHCALVVAEEKTPEKHKLAYKPKLA